MNIKQQLINGQIKLVLADGTELPLEVVQQKDQSGNRLTITSCVDHLGIEDIVIRVSNMDI